MNRIHRQDGVVLVVSLIMLLVMTLLIVSAINTNTASFKIVGNAQAQKAMETADQWATEQVIGNLDRFTAPEAKKFYAKDGTAVNVSAPVCLGSRPASGWSALSTVSAFDTDWDVQATTNNLSGTPVETPVTTHQGVKITMLGNSCP